jgi:hypothetical protein
MTIISGSQMIIAVVALVFVSTLFAMWSIYRLIQDGWELKLKIKNAFPSCSVK